MRVAANAVNVACVRKAVHLDDKAAPGIKKEFGVGSFFGLRASMRAAAAKWPARRRGSPGHHPHPTGRPQHPTRPTPR